MSLATVYLRKTNTIKISREIRTLKKQFNIGLNTEIKWTKVSPSCLEFYKALVDYVASCKPMRIRTLVATGKKILNLPAFGLTYEDWYYAMYYTMLNTVIHFSKTYTNRVEHHKLIIDYKDSNMKELSNKLASYLTRKFKNEFIISSTVEDSMGVIFIQLADLFAGAAAAKNIKRNLSESKLFLIKYIEEKLNVNFEITSTLNDKKCNNFIWQPRVEL